MHREFIRPGLDHALGRAIEEAGEVLSALGKTLRFGWDSSNPLLPENERETNELWVRREVADLQHALTTLIEELNNNRGIPDDPSLFPL